MAKIKKVATVWRYCSQEMPATDAKQFLHNARAVADVMKPLDLETSTK